MITATKKSYTWAVETREVEDGPWRVAAMDTETSPEDPEVFLERKAAELRATGEWHLVEEWGERLTVHRWSNAR